MARRYERERRVALEGVRAAGRLCQGVRAGVDPGVLVKDDLSPVTVADYGSQAVVCRFLEAAFPDDPVVGEEDAAALREPDNRETLAQVVGHVRTVDSEADEQSVLRTIDHGGHHEGARRFWTVDPIDGTKGFLRGDQYAVALALIEDGTVVVSALACPMLPLRPGDQGTTGVVFVAVRGEGAVGVPLEENSEEEIRVSDASDPTGARSCESLESGHSAHDHAAQVREKLGTTAAPVRVDSQAKYGLVARGDAELYLRIPTRPGRREKIWDHAAGVGIVVEAGGQVTDLFGHPLRFTEGETLASNQGVVVTNGRLHTAVQKAIERTGLLNGLRGG